jgi:hypothetical protein
MLLSEEGILKAFTRNGIVVEHVHERCCCYIESVVNDDRTIKALEVSGRLVPAGSDLNQSQLRNSVYAKLMIIRLSSETVKGHRRAGLVAARENTRPTQHSRISQCKVSRFWKSCGGRKHRGRLVEDFEER